MPDTNQQNDPSNPINHTLHKQDGPVQHAPTDPVHASDTDPASIEEEGVPLPDTATAIPSPTLPTRGNPFTPGTPPPPERFFGRAWDKRQILQRLETMSSTALVGEARIGKTSLLKYLAAYLPVLLDETYLPVYICADVCDNQASFYKKMLGALLPQIQPQVCSEKLLRTLEVKKQPARDDIEAILDQGLKVVLLLDEFKSMLDKPLEFDEPFLRWLRSLCNKGKVAMSVATRQPLDGITPFDLYFANHITQVVELKELRPDEAQTLLSQPHDRPFTADELAIGLQAGRNHPLRLQEAGFMLYTSKGEPPGDLHDQAGLLRPNAGNLLKKHVAQNYKQAQKWSRPSARNHNHPNRPDVLATVGQIVIRIGDGIDQGQARFYGIVVVLLIVLFVLLLVASLLGWISLEQFQTFWNVLTGGM